MKSNLSHLKPSLKVIETHNEIKCYVVFKGEMPKNIKSKLINPDGVLRSSYSFTKIVTNRKLIDRFSKAVKAGVIFKNPFINSGGGVWDTDPSNKTPRWVEPFTYLDCEGFVILKYLDSDLKKLGF